VIIEDPKISDAVRHQQPFISLYPDTVASKCIRSIASNFLQHKADAFAARPITTFFKHFIAIIKGQLNLKGVKDDKEEPHPPAKPAVTSLYSTAEKKPAPSACFLPAGPEHSTQAEISGATYDEPQQEQTIKAGQEAPVTSALPTLSENLEAPGKPSGAAANMFPAIDQNLYSILNTLISSIASISDELKLLRKASEENGKALYGKDNSGNKSFSSDQQKPIVLEFEKFLNSKRRKP
ncbi:MAG: hypothetical protein WCQ99_02235, partial [Pseudomonadota bacterium]